MFPADFIIPFENIYKDRSPPSIRVEFRSLDLWAPVDSVSITPTDNGVTPSTTSSRPPEIHTYPAAVSFAITDNETGDHKEYTYALAKDINFVTAHPCAPSRHVKILKSPSSPTIQQVDLSGNGIIGKTASVVGKSLDPRWYIFERRRLTACLGHPLHKYYTYTALHLSELLAKQDFSIEALLGDYSSTAHRPSLTPASIKTVAKVLVIDCITGFQSLPQEHEIPLSPVVSRSESFGFGGAGPRSPMARRMSSMSSEHESAMVSSPTSPGGMSDSGFLFESASKKMHSETRRRQFGSDAEMLVRAICAERGWNALISRRRRGCLACAIREAGALGWKVIVRVD